MTADDDDRSGRIDLWTSLAPSSYLARPARSLPFPLEDGNCQLFVRARHALYYGVLALGLKPGDQVLVPDYHDGAHVEALSHAGIDCVFYAVTPDLAPDRHELSELVGERCRALYLTHVLGFPQDASAWRRWCDKRGLQLIEDATHAWLATSHDEPVGSHGDLSIFSMHKTVPVPSVSAAVTWAPMQRPPGKRVGDVRTLATLHRSWLAVRGGVAQRMLSRAGLGDTEQASPPYAVGADLELGDPTVRPDPWATYLLPRMPTTDIARARRENYRILLEQLGDLVPAPFDRLSPGASPLAFPVEVPDKAALLRRLADSDIRGADLWAAPHPSAERHQTGATQHRRRSIVALPVHQRLSGAQLDRIADSVRPQRRPSERLRSEPVHDMDAVREEWTALAQQTRNIFASWEWQQTWWNHFGDDRPRMVTALRDSSDTLRALLPIYLSSERPLRIARFIGNKAGDQLGPICAPGDEPAVSRAARSLLRDGKWDVLLGEQMPGTSAWSKRLSGRTVRREGNPVVTFKDSWEATSKAWSKRLRKELRRDERRLRERHDMHVRTVTDPDELESSLDTFFALHRIRWTQGTVFEQREAFHRDFARVAFHHGWLRLRFMDIDGEPAAARLGFRYGDIESGYQSGWLPQYSAYSIGILLVADTIRAAHSDGMREYRFLRGGEDYKYRFASADPGLETAFFARGAASGVVSGAVALADSAVIRQMRRAADTDG